MVSKTLSTIKNLGSMTKLGTRKRDFSRVSTSPHSMRVEQLSVFYGRKPALKNVNLHIEPGCITALIGPSGCGKTSFLNCLNRLNELTPACQVSGMILLSGMDVKAMHVMELRRRVGMLFQKPRPFPLSISQNIVFPLKEHGVKNKQQITNITEGVLRDVGLWNEVKDRLNAPALSLSGGQQQRLCLARALALKPDILLMDEPCSALDPISSEIVEDLIVKLRGKYTVVIVTHNLGQARRIADNVALFWAVEGVGQLVEYSSSAQIFETPQHELTTAYISGRRG